MKNETRMKAEKKRKKKDKENGKSKLKDFRVRSIVSNSRMLISFPFIGNLSWDDLSVESLLPQPNELYQSATRQYRATAYESICPREYWNEGPRRLRRDVT